MSTLTFGEVLRRVRQARRMTLDGLGKRSGSSKGYLSGIENGKVNPPRPKEIARLSKTLGVNESALQMLAFVNKAPKCVRGAEEFEKFAVSVDVTVRINVLNKL